MDYLAQCLVIKHELFRSHLRFISELSRRARAPCRHPVAVSRAESDGRKPNVRSKVILNFMSSSNRLSYRAAHPGINGQVLNCERIGMGPVYRAPSLLKYLFRRRFVRLKILALMGALLFSSMLFADTLGFFEQKFSAINFERGKWSRGVQPPVIRTRQLRAGRKSRFSAWARVTSSHSRRKKD